MKPTQPKGPISYWNAYVAVTQMHGQAIFPTRGWASTSNTRPIWWPIKTARIAQLSTQPARHSLLLASFDTASAEARACVFDRNCATCHVGGSGTDNNMKASCMLPLKLASASAYAARTVNKAYRTTPLRHSGSIRRIFVAAPHRTDVVAHCDKGTRARFISVAAARAD